MIVMSCSEVNMKLKFSVNDIFSIFTRLITNIQRCIIKIKDKNMKSIGLKSGHVSCLYYLYKSGPLSQTELCEICNENKASISRKLDYLTKNDYTRRDISETNKYKNPIVLTEKGRQIAVFIDSKVKEIILEADSVLNENERINLYSSLEKINTKLQKMSLIGRK